MTQNITITDITSLETVRPERLCPPLAPPVEATLYGRILARYAFRLDGGSVWLHDREDADVRDIEVVADPQHPGETLWVHSYPGAPFSWCVYGAAVQLWRTTSISFDSVPFDSVPFDSVSLDHVAAARRESITPLSPEDVRRQQTLRAYRDMRAMEDAARLRAVCRAEARMKKAQSRLRTWWRRRFP